MSSTPSHTFASFRVLVGLEIHVQLATKSKMFTAAPNHSVAKPNSLVDAQVIGLPGTLPVLNRTAIESSIMVGIALGCRIARHTKWDRKSYFYPDLPKNYQISQYDLPLCAEGSIDVADETGEPKTIRIRRAHLEEDAGKLMHEAPGGHAIAHSIVDLNRAGTPLLEIVTEPDFVSAKHVALFAQELQKLVQFLGVSEAQMQLGQMRFEPNINLHITDASGAVHKTAITEIKNLNSFSVLERATAYEIQRQLHEWETSGTLGKKCTMGWDESRSATFLQREKEEAHDYRYFPDPDLVPLDVSDEWLSELKSRVGELPAARRKRYVEALGLSPADAAILAGDRPTGDFFEAAGATKRVANLLLSHGKRLANERNQSIAALGIAAKRFGEIAAMIDANTLAVGSAGALFDSLIERDEPPEALAKRLGLIQVSDTGPIDAAIDALIATNPQSLIDFRAGKQAALGSLVGMVMKSAKGLNPKMVQERLKAKIG